MFSLLCNSGKHFRQIELPHGRVIGMRSGREHRAHWIKPSISMGVQDMGEMWQQISLNRSVAHQSDGCRRNWVDRENCNLECGCYARSCPSPTFIRAVPGPPSVGANHIRGAIRPPMVSQVISTPRWMLRMIRAVLTGRRSSRYPATE